VREHFQVVIGEVKVGRKAAQHIHKSPVLRGRRFFRERMGCPGYGQPLWLSARFTSGRGSKFYLQTRAAGSALSNACWRQV